PAGCCSASAIARWRYGGNSHLAHPARRTTCCPTCCRGTCLPAPPKRLPCRLPARQSDDFRHFLTDTGLLFCRLLAREPIFGWSLLQYRQFLTLSTAWSGVAWTLH